MKQKIKIIQTIIFIFFISFPFYANAMTVEEIIKGRKAIFSENYQNSKKISILLKSKKIEEAKPLMKKISDNYKKLLDYFHCVVSFYYLNLLLRHLYNSTIQFFSTL